MQIRSAARTDVGRHREQNEDFQLSAEDLGLFVVCDGMGGHAAGDLASRTAAAAVERYVREHRDILRSFDGKEAACEHVSGMLRRAVEAASSEVFELASQGHGRHGMGTTCICLMTVKDHGFMAHVGDSRLYLQRDGRVHQLSQDHTYVHEAVRHGMLTPEDAVKSPYANVVTRAVGVQRSVQVDTLVIDVLPGDTYLLCSDGLHGYAEQESILGESMAGPNLENAAVQLIAFANERGGKDNVTALLVRALAEVPESPTDVRRRNQVNTDLAALRYIALFMDLEMAELVRVAHAFRAANHPAGHVVIREGDASESLFVIVEGDLEVSRAGQHLANVGRGSHFGEMALLNHRPRAATVTTVTAVRLLCLEREAFHDLLRGDAGVACKFLYKLAQILSLRLDEHYVTQSTVQDRRTMELGVLSPFRPRH